MFVGSNSVTTALKTRIKNSGRCNKKNRTQTKCYVKGQKKL